jgi:hypothetical protein
LAVSVDENRITAALIDSVYSSDESGCLYVADADGARFASNTCVADVDIVIARGQRAAGVHTGCNIVGAGVVKERTKTVGRVVVAGGVEQERIKTVGRVVAPGGVAIKRTITDGRVVAAACEAEERRITLSGVAVGIASVRCRGNRSGRRRKCKPGEGERDEEESEPQRRPAD